MAGVYQIYNYALDNTGSFMKKLDCYFIRVAGEK